MQYVATFRNVKGRYLVEHEGGGSYGGQKIVGAPGTAAYARQTDRYHNHPDRSTGLMLDEMYRTFSSHELLTLKAAPTAR